MTVVTLYGKPGCHLCDDAREAVSAVRARRAFELEEVDITLDPALYRRLGERIPVLEIDGEEAFELGVDPQELEERLGTVDR
jgi:glutaredoxin